ncbi:hypothetical protein N9W61_03615 [Algibacter sp.]|nr:hypothetical protein [Algibacter sp.]
MLILPIPLLIMELKKNQSLRASIFRKAIPVLVIIGLLFINPLALIFNTPTWKTQTVVLVNENMSNHKVEFQIKNTGARGYAKRKAEVVYLSNYFYVVLAKKYDDSNFSNHQWKRVNQDINEMGLK